MTIKDALRNLAPNSGAPKEYCQGLVVGIVSEQMAHNPYLKFEKAIKYVADNLPGNYRPSCIPAQWRIFFVSPIKEN